MARAAFGATRPAGGAQLGESRLPPVVAPGGHWWNHTGSNAIGRRGLGRATWTDRTIWQRGSQRSEEHTSELQSLMRISYAVFCLKKKKKNITNKEKKNKHNIHTNTNNKQTDKKTNVK